MRFEDRRLAEDAAWQDFVRRLGDHLGGQWPAMPARLGERYPAFVDAAVDQGLRRGLQDGVAVARWVNLCFAWGPAFDEKPGFSWAADILSAPGRSAWLMVHQLVQHSLQELARQPGARLSPQDLLAADRRLVQAFADQGPRGASPDAAEAPLPRALLACDLDVVALRQTEQVPLSHYRLDGDVWSRAREAALAPLRVDLQHALPARLHLLSPMQGQPASLHIHSQAHASCDSAHHPLLRCTGPLAASSLAGQDSRAAELEFVPRPQPGPPSGPATLVAEETAPEYYKLEWESCGLRDAGPVLGPLSTLLSVWPACRWWAEFQRAEPPMQALLGTPGSDGRPSVKAWQRGNTRARIERDGQTQDALALRQAFEAGLDGASALAIERLARAWAQVAEVHEATLDAGWGHLLGRAALSWGWHSLALDAAPSMRVLGRLDLQAAQIDLTLRGTLQWGEALARLELRCAGRTPLALALRQEGTAPALGEQISACASVAWRFPFDASLTPMAGPGGALLQLDGPIDGALVGMAGLRPNTHGGSGFEWFAETRLEALRLPLALTDPLTGHRQGHIELLPSQPLLAWSLGDG